MSSAQPTLTIIGFGAFGQLLARELASHARISVYDRSGTARAAARRAGFDVLGALCEVKADIVILAVALPAIDACLRELAPHLRRGQIVIDVCSVKEEPARLMRKHLPAHVELLATHPMFGPQSAREGVAGRQIVLCPLRGRRWRRLAAFLSQRLKLAVVVTTPEEHDRQAARTQGLVHLLAQAFATLGEPPKIRTRSFELMTEALEMVRHDAPEVFDAVTRGNPYLAPLRNKLCLALLDDRNASGPWILPPRAENGTGGHMEHPVGEPIAACD